MDVVALGSDTDFETGENRVGFTYGTYLDAAHPEDRPWPVPREKVQNYHTDIRVFHENVQADPLPFDDDYLAAVAARLHDVAIPFLDRMGDYDFVKEVLETDRGIPPDSYLESHLGSPARSELLGMLALAAGDRTTALHHLELSFQAATAWAEKGFGGSPESDQAAVTFWAAKLERASALS